MGYLNRPLTSIEIESVIKKIKNLQQIKVKAQSAPQGNSSKYISKPLFILPKLFQKTEEDGTLPNSFCEATITLLPKTDKSPTKKRELTNIFDEYSCKNPLQNTSKPASTLYKKDHIP